MLRGFQPYCHLLKIVDIRDFKSLVSTNFTTRAGGARCTAAACKLELNRQSRLLKVGEST